MLINLEFFCEEVDAIGALLKREIWKKQIKPRGKKIQNAAEVVAFLKSKAKVYHVAHPNARQHINKFFHEVDVGNIDRNKKFECETMKGSKAKHQVRSLSPKDPTICQFVNFFVFVKVVWEEILKPSVLTKTMCLNGY